MPHRLPNRIFALPGAIAALLTLPVLLAQPARAAVVYVDATGVGLFGGAGPN